MDNYLTNKISIGVSACQFGCKVRYNSKGWDRVGNLQREKNDFIWHPVCPEVMAGLGIPRPAIKLSRGNGDDFWEGTSDIYNKFGARKSKELKESCIFCRDLLLKNDVDVFIYMDGSPTCGVYRTTMRGHRMGKPPGIFGSLLLKENLFLIPAIDLQSPVKWWDWRRRMYAFIWLKKQEIETLNDMYEAWHIIKFLCQELFRKKSDKIGNLLAKGQVDNKEQINQIKDEILMMLRQPSDVKRIKQALWKNYTFLRKKGLIDVEEVLSPEDRRGMIHLAKELVKVEVVSKQKDVLFGPSPIYLKHGK